MHHVFVSIREWEGMVKFSERWKQNGWGLISLKSLVFATHQGLRVNGTGNDRALRSRIHAK